MNSVAILMSTYNGESFIKEQIDSLLSQTVSNLKIYIRDDGSTDSTKNILRAYSKEHPKKFKIYFGENVGSSFSFFWLLQNTKADIYFFCDQDDIWETNKVELHLSNHSDFKKPRMVFSDMSIIGNPDSTLLKLQKMDANYLISKPLRMLCQNCVAGCTMSLNLAARNNIVNHGKIPKGVVHDHWISVLTSINGEVHFLPNLLVKYRLHENNQVGSQAFNIFYITKRLANLKATVTHDILMIKKLSLVKKPFIAKYFFTKIGVNLNRFF